MSKIKAIGNGFVQIGEALINLKAYKNIAKGTFGIGEDPDGKSAFGITLTPLTPTQENIENGVDGTFFITTYTFEESDDFEADFELIITALKD